MITQIVTGDDAVFQAQLYKDAAVFSIDAGATVEAMLVSIDHETTYTDAVTLSNVAAGADWPNSLVIVEFSESETAAIAVTGNVLLEVQVDDTIKETWFGVVQVITGQIA